MILQVLSEWIKKIGHNFSLFHHPCFFEISLLLSWLLFKQEMCTDLRAERGLSDCPIFLGIHVRWLFRNSWGGSGWWWPGWWFIISSLVLVRILVTTYQNHRACCSFMMYLDGINDVKMKIIDVRIWGGQLTFVCGLAKTWTLICAMDWPWA